MDEARGYLFAGEEVALVIRPHPIVLAKSLLAPLAAIALLSAFFNTFTFVVFCIVMLRFSWDAAMWWMDRYVLSTERVLSLSGIITKKVVTLPLEKITDLTYERSLLGRVLGYGSLGFESAGQQDFGRIDFVPDSDEFYRAVMALALGPRPSEQPAPEPQRAPEPDAYQSSDSHQSNVNPDNDPMNTDEVPVVGERFRND